MEHSQAEDLQECKKNQPRKHQLICYASLSEHTNFAMSEIFVNYRDLERLHKVLTPTSCSGFCDLGVGVQDKQLMPVSLFRFVTLSAYTGMLKNLHFTSCAETSTSGGSTVLSLSYNQPATCIFERKPKNTLGISSRNS